MSRDALPQEEEPPAQGPRPQGGQGSTTIGVTQTVGAITGGEATGVKIGTIVGPVYIQSGAAGKTPGEDLRQAVIKTVSIEPETVLIPAGAFLMGSDDPAAPEWERQHPVDLPDFRIGRYPVTVRQYAAFVKQEKTQAVPRAWRNREPPQDRLDHPMTNVSWHDALAYCAWLSKKTGRPYCLPSEAEWEKAASWDPRLTKKRAYPWGNAWLDGLCNAGGSETTAVSAHPAGASAYGVEDLLGNVEEWTRSLWGDRPEEPEFGYPYDPTDGREVTAAAELPVLGRPAVRGGYYESAAAELTCTARDNALADSKVARRGFRIAIKID